MTSSVLTSKDGARPPSIEDDEDGHLVYKEGDVLQARCTHAFP